MLQLRPQLTSTPRQVYLTDDLALVINEWTMTGTARDGTTVEQGGRSTDVLRRQPDGHWLIAIDRP